MSLLKQLRIFAATAAAIAGGAVTMATGGSEPGDVVLRPGDRAPDFTLEGSDGGTYHLREILGHGHGVVIAWFPKAFTGGCTAECQSLDASGPDLQRFNVRHFAMSVDSAEANARFARSLGITYPILSDPTKAVARAYGVLYAGGYASRWTFYIGADGRIVDIDSQVRAALHGRDIVAKLTEMGM